MAAFKEIVMQRYAAQRFDGRAVPEETITGLLELVRFAPSSASRTGRQGASVGADLERQHTFQ